MQLRPRAIRRLLWNPEVRIRHAIRWYYRMGRRVWLHEMREFLFRDRTGPTGMTVRAFVGDAQDHEEESMAVGARRPAAQAAKAA